MKKLLLFALLALAGNVYAQTVSFTLTLAPCNNNGILTGNATGLVPPLTFTWYTHGTTGATITHSGVTGLSDALTSYSGGPVELSVSDATGSARNYYSGMPPFTYSATTTPAVCPALGSATATVSGGTAPYTYSWFDESTSAVVGTTNPISLPTGTYGVTITDAAGCVYGSLVQDDSINVYAVPTFTVVTTSTVASCTNGTASVTGTPGATLPVSYLWSTGATSSSVGSLLTGYYTVTVTDALGCTGMGYPYVPQSPVITAHVTPTPTTCTASNGVVTVFGSGGTPPYSYLWSTGSTLQTMSGLPAGSYSVDIADANGCIGRGGGYVTASTPIIATYTTTPSSCTSPTGSATLTLSGGSGGVFIKKETPPPPAITAFMLLMAPDVCKTVRLLFPR